MSQRHSYDFFIMKRMPILASIANEVSSRMPQLALDTLSKGLRFDPLFKANTNLDEFISNNIKSGFDSLTCKKGNLTSDEGGKWSKILSHLEGIWKVRARISQRLGLELTMVNLPNT